MDTRRPKSGGCMLLETILVIGGAITTVAIGGPMVSALVRPHVFRRPSPRDTSSRRERGAQPPAFTPLDLGEDPVQWPSAKPWSGSSSRPDPDWPSRHWDDEHFGAHWRDGRAVETRDMGFHAMAKRSYDATLDPAEALRRNERAMTEGRGDKAPHPARREKKGATKSNPNSDRVELPAPRAPTREELERRIAEVGLAETVQEIMQRMGWDFRKAAQYLGNTRRHGP